MRIAIIHYRLIRHGGLERRFRNYIDFFHRKGHDITVIYHKRDPEINIPSDIKEIRIGLGVMPKQFKFWYFNRKLGRVMKDHEFDFSLSLGRTAHQTAVIAPTTHLGYMKALKKNSRGLIDRINIHMDNQAYTNSQIIFACSSKIKDEITSMHNILPDKVQILYPPLNNKMYFQK